MLIRTVTDIRTAEITPEHVYLNRRRFIGETTRAALGAAVAPGLLTVPGLTSGCADAELRDETTRPQERDWSQTRSELD